MGEYNSIFWVRNSFVQIRTDAIEVGKKSGRGRTGADKGEDVFLRESRERVLVRAVEDLLAHPVPPAFRGRFQDEVAEHPRAHVVRGGTRRRLAADGPEEEPGAAGVGVVPGRVRLAAEHVVREGLERWRRVVVVFAVPERPAAGHGGRCDATRFGGLGLPVCVHEETEQETKGVCVLAK